MHDSGELLERWRILVCRQAAGVVGGRRWIYRWEGMNYELKRLADINALPATRGQDDGTRMWTSSGKTDPTNIITLL
jgi:hypothetical protein